MAMFAAVACGIANNRQRPRSRNIKRVSCQSNEKCETYLHLKEEDVKELTLRLRVLDQSLIWTRSKTGF